MRNRITLFMAGVIFTAQSMAQHFELPRKAPAQLSAISQAPTPDIQTVNASLGRVTQDKAKDDFSLSYGRHLDIYDIIQMRLADGLKFIAGMEVERYSNQKLNAASTQHSQQNQLHLGMGIGVDFGKSKKRGMTYGLDLLYTPGYRNPKELRFVRLGLLPSLSLQYNL